MPCNACEQQLIIETQHTAGMAQVERRYRVIIFNSGNRKIAGDKDVIKFILVFSFVYNEREEGHLSQII